MAHLPAAAVVSGSSIRFHAPHAGAEHALVKGTPHFPGGAKRCVMALAGMCAELVVNICDYTQHDFILQIEHPPG